GGNCRCLNHWGVHNHRCIIRGQKKRRLWYFMVKHCNDNGGGSTYFCYCNVDNCLYGYL
ncbi:hypothetical protein, partial [uncultured Gammaproteobacteria bacterium]